MGGCSFCTDALYGEPQFRSEGSIVREVASMRALGLERFRLGAISCTFTYMAEGIGESETPKPNPDAWKRVLTGICSPSKPKVLHTDNANPAVMSAQKEETDKILKMLVEHCTPGNVLSLGMESADETVIKANRLNATPDDVLEAIRMINKVGRARGANGMPLLLPGLNFVTGLDGESKDTFGKNIAFLEKVMSEGLLLRRINIREVAPWRKEFRPKHRSEARRFKQRVREQIDRRMLMEVVPTGTVMGEVYLEQIIGNVTFGRQIGTYPLLVGIPDKLPLNRFIDALVASHGERSVTALEHPVRINTIPMRALAEIPGIGRKRAASIVRARPFEDERELLDRISDSHCATSFLKGNVGFG
jgi:radical SAM superfamily enzyme with C-terminal helix-hairpin-helix motif